MLFALLIADLFASRVLSANMRKRVTQKDAKNPHAVALSRLGASKGGKARAKKLTPARRREIAKVAAQARWKKH